MTSIRSFVNRLIKKNAFITIVSGLPRSGTSLMMSVLKAGGMALIVDGIREPDANNPKGYFEYERAKKLPKGDTGWLNSAQGKAVKIISALLEYLPKNFQYRVIFMERDMDEILASQQRMLDRIDKGDHAGVPDDEIRQSYQQHLEEIKSWLASQDWIRTLFISYNDLLRQPGPIFHKVADFLDHHVDPVAMSGVVDLSLYREKNLKDMNE